MGRHLVMPCLLAVLLSAGRPVAGQAAEVELLGNGDFEKGAATGLPEGWVLNGVGAAEVVADAHGGQRALRVTFGQEMTGCYAPKIPVRFGVQYHASFWAKGAGAVQLTIYQYSESGHFLGSKFLEGHPVSAHWQRFDETYTPADEYVGSVAFALHVVGANSSAIFDDASFTFDAAKYPPPKVEVAATTLRLRVTTRDATATLFLDGTEVPTAQGEASLTLTEGAHVLGLAANATGDAPAVRVTCPEHPYLQTAFCASASPGDGWPKVGFDQSAWAPAQADSEGWLWLAGAPRGVSFRQVVGYTHTFDGPQRCLAPRVREWEWPQGAMQVMNLWLRPLDEKAYGKTWSAATEFRFVLEVPRPFRMLETETRCVSWFDLITPSKVTATAITRDGMAYTRYDIAFPRNFHAERPLGCFSAVCLKPEATVPQKQVRFYYRRQPAGNQTELEVAVPVRMIPPVNGKMPRQILQWSPLPPVEDTSGISSHEEALESARLHAAMGLNTWSARPEPFPRSAERKQRWDEALREFQRLGGRYAIWLWNSLGLNYGFAEYFAPGPTRYLKEHPDIQARWYKGENPKAYGEGHFNYCNEWAGSEASAPFWEQVRQTYALSLANWPQPAFLFFDWEYARIDQQGRGNHCFCDRCQQAFREFAKLPADAPLDDETDRKSVV